ncbi:hypothetical protein GN157_12925 [Flavobacterium rakeshii]|uniref:Uncharacterized protein n=1 Tax=Flavobacterium rakeshii TaxID=1038845 RepID=A0A6N8HFY8_9FLAO|nr:hypothetical protein [Flavobacterium rakeshii]MUV04613.1 hypothetical protein [Flavobacterium rakeshii]
MLTTNEVAQVFETILSSPGMNDAVRIDMRISRKNVLLLTHVIEQRLISKGETKDVLLASVSNDTRDELKGILVDFLEKAGLVELSEKLQQFSQLPQKQ